MLTHVPEMLRLARRDHTKGVCFASHDCSPDAGVVTPCRADHHCYLVALDMARVCGEQCYQRVFGRLATRANDIAWEVLVFPSRISSMIRRPGR